MPRYKIILNPTAGRGSGELAYPQIESRFVDLGLDFELIRTQAPGHAIQLAEQAVQDGFDVVVAAGGDGTANEVLNGLARSILSGAGRAALGILTVGRGNDFGFGIGAPHDLEAAILALVGDHRKTIDVGFVRGGDYPDGRYFGNGVGIGFDAVVGFEALKLKRLSGFPSYIVAALKTIFLYFHAPKLHIQLDGQEITQPSLMVSIMNGRRMGGGFMMAPEGKPDDGLFDLCIVAQVSRPGIFGLIPKFMSGTQAGHPAVHFARSKKVSVTALEGVLPAHADGETVCVAGQRLELELLPGLLDVIVPETNPG
jgi:YegS/Rv2252/BmrU family lipid kinase